MNPPSFLGAPSSFSTFPPSFPNPNPNLVYPHFGNQIQASSTAATTSLAPPPLDLPTALSTLKHLVRLSESTLHSLSTLLPPTSATAAATCPFNPHHRVSPESLFRHSLHCPSAPTLDLDLYLSSLRYPNTLRSSDDATKHNRFVQALHDRNSEYCFSLDEYCDFGPNFFYRDCPGIVTSPNQDGTSRTFTMPGILSIECANFMPSGNGEIKGFPAKHIGLLPSELWVVWNEIAAWNDYPTNYSYSVLRAVLCSRIVQEYDFLTWVIGNSPEYGVVIDVALRDHVVLLFRLCMKAIVNEAVALVESVKELNVPAISFKCPVLVQVLMWLSFQLSVLYGELNAKLFAINMLKQWILNASSNSSLYPMGQNVPEIPALKDADGRTIEFSETIVDDKENSLVDESNSSIEICVSQVAAAVAALHERSLLEQKVKALRDDHLLTGYQRIVEHAYLSTRADEERQKRPNYRPLLEHDGLLWQRPQDQDTNKTKTREELLAEERDYKRRRMSYRGKKVKRTTTQVMRDIIDEYMESITQAGTIGSLLNDSEKEGKFPCEPSLGDIYSNVDGLKKNLLDTSEEKRPYGYKKELYSSNDIIFTRFESESPENSKQHGRDSGRHREHLESQRCLDRDSHYREHYSKSSDRQSSHGRSSDHKHRDDVELSRNNVSRSADNSQRWSHERTNYQREQGDNRHSRSHERTSHRRERNDLKTETKDRRRKHASRDLKSESVPVYEIDDRYDPTESHDMYEKDGH
ncbi:U11/U12 small nuclear ribonucleoprotein 48 kDa protein [Diospyros lotus]|uniref:U11/U12 small nuclear ribonucleoprotein 48 kDa protein n=1 Tax=Diospyros lotus TaxID=55363 RepID=UPI00224D6AE7|nr:U11/U12 small nuclear ribonucleoprotein 48 kDa protein [Diospyros lotus]XP_052200049.1 U11/U12 small nuclear ribonucleoprotein 48 kDa protein [Diospyros lotus]XP_052200057.1 U11/U12 small nuclear ribonucleoprotein 48 kDa protein [Diospyros lotus]XP_052200066.1 U11/U12 small nuclear ribonucleoprotein 48 kDa protein [Diospyros lotus]